VSALGRREAQNASPGRGARQVQRLAWVLGRLGELRRLSLRANRLGSDGLKSLAPALRSTLTDLDLADNGIGPDGIAALAARLPDVTNLTRLDLSRNHFSAVLGHHSEPDPPGAGGGGPVGPAARAGAVRAPRGGKPYKVKGPGSTVFRTVAKKMSEAGSEVRRPPTAMFAWTPSRARGAPRRDSEAWASP
jgi:hypothetical protein